MKRIALVLVAIATVGIFLATANQASAHDGHRCQPRPVYVAPPYYYSAYVGPTYAYRPGLRYPAYVVAPRAPRVVVPASPYGPQYGIYYRGNGVSLSVGF